MAPVPQLKPFKSTCNVCLSLPLFPLSSDFLLLCGSLVVNATCANSWGARALSLFSLRFIIINNWDIFGFRSSGSLYQISSLPFSIANQAFRSAYRSRMPRPVSSSSAALLPPLPLPKAYVWTWTYARVRIRRGTINTGAAPIFQAPFFLETATKTAATAAPRAINTLHMAPAFCRVLLGLGSPGTAVAIFSVLYSGFVFISSLKIYAAWRGWRVAVKMT